MKVLRSAQDISWVGFFEGSPNRVVQTRKKFVRSLEGPQSPVSVFGFFLELL